MMTSVALGLNIQLTKFEGPLALLLYLIRKEEMDIMDIRINEITSQYLEYIKMMKELDLELAGEFVAMAATLLQIKSRMLLPNYDENGEVIENEDPRKELVQRLLEYQKYQEAAQLLYERPLLGRDVFARGSREKLEAKEDEIIIEDNALFALISAYRSALRGAKKSIHKVAAKLQSIANRIVEIRDRLVLGQKVAMGDLINATQDRHRQVLITFLSLLELGKMGFVRLFQTDTYTEIYIEAQKEIEEAALSRVEEYEHVDKTDDILNSSPGLDANIADSNIKVDLSDADFENLDPEIQQAFDLDTETESTEFTESNTEMATDEEILAAEAELDQEVNEGV